MIHPSTSCEFPKSIEEFGYIFNDEGRLRDIKTNERFEFFVKPDDQLYNQRHYEALGDAIGEHIENELVSKYGLLRHLIPVGSEEDEDAFKSRIYLSDGAADCQDLLLLIQGSGVVRPGQWARQVIINDSLELGTMYPYIRKAQELNWGIMIFNPNENYGKIVKDDKTISGSIKGSESSDNHCLYVWNHFVRNFKAKKILIVAHSYGGINTAHLLSELVDDFKSRVIAIALTDSVHSSSMIPTQSKKWFTSHAVNWIKSSLSVNRPIPEAKKFYGCRCLSAGHPKHEYTSGTAFEHVFDFLQYRLGKSYEQKNDVNANKDPDANDVDINDTNDMDVNKDPDTDDAGVNKDPDTNNMEIDDPVKDDKKHSEETTSTNTLNDMEVDNDAANVGDDKPMEGEKKDCGAANDTSTPTDLNENIMSPKNMDDTVDLRDDKSTESKTLDPETTINTATFTDPTSENIDSKEDSKVKNDISIPAESSAEDIVDSNQSENVGESLNSESDITPPSTETSVDDNQQGTSTTKDASPQESTKSEAPLSRSVSSSGPEPSDADEVTAQERMATQSREDNAGNPRQIVLHPDNYQNIKSDVNGTPPKMDIDDEPTQRKEQSPTADQVPNQSEAEVASSPPKEV